jgi:hypothetical protein
MGCTEAPAVAEHAEDEDMLDREEGKLEDAKPSDMALLVWSVSDSAEPKQACASRLDAVTKKQLTEGIV